MNCPKCGREIPEKPNNCSSCGYRDPRKPISIYAVLSLISGILSFSGIKLYASEPLGTISFFLWTVSTVLAIVFGAIGIKQANEGAFRGRKMAVVGMLLLIPSVLITARVVANRSNEASEIGACRNHIQQLGTAALMYSVKHDGKLPPNETWYTELKPYIKDPSIIKCPFDRDSECSYVYNKYLPPTLDEIPVPEETVLFFEGETIWNGEPITIKAKKRHLNRVSVVFADGHTRTIEEVPPLKPPLKAATEAGEAGSR